MSAYLCNSEHIAALAVFAVKQGSVLSEYRKDADPVKTARNVAQEMMRQNIASITHRYPNHNLPDSADVAIVAEVGDLAERYYFAPNVLSPLEIVKMAQCYEYQSCETGNWKNTLQKRQSDWIIGEAIRKIAGYDAAPWNYDGSRHREYIKGPKPVLLSLS